MNENFSTLAVCGDSVAAHSDSHPLKVTTDFVSFLKMFWSFFMRAMGKTHNELEMLKCQLAEAKAKEKELEEELAAKLEAELHDEKGQFHILPLVILLEGIADKNAVAPEMNKSDFVRLLNKISGYKFHSIYNKIPPQGLDYHRQRVRKLAKKVIDAVKPVSNEVAQRIEKKLEKSVEKGE